jgi:NDP-sugar pyrophosphorylase family protein
MKAMILAAGLGTRLRPLTDDRPKALVTVAGRTLLEITLSRLRAFGVSEVIVNAHHYADMIADYLTCNHNFGMRIEVSREQDLLDTGGGLKKAAHFFLDPGLLDSGSNSQQPFIVHNVDVLSTIDLGRMMRFHTSQAALATLAVQHRETSRPLLFDQRGKLVSRLRKPAVNAEAPDAETPNAEFRQQEHAGEAGQHGYSETVPIPPSMRLLAFSGIHILSLQIFSKMQDEGAFSIIDAYIQLAAQGEKILAFEADEYYWRDLGRPENVTQAASDLASGIYPAN